MKTISLVLIGLVLSCTNLFAGDDSNVSFKSSVLSGYTDMDGQQYYTKPVIQSEITVSLVKGFYVDVWHSTGVNMKSSDGNEIETSLGWSHEGAFSVDVGVSYYDLNSLFHGPRNDLYVWYAKVSHEYDMGILGSFKPVLEINSYKASRKSDFEGGFRAKVSVEYSQKFSIGQVGYALSLVRDDGTFSSAPAWVMGHEWSLSRKIGKVTLKLPMLMAYVPLSSHSGRKTSMVVGVGINL
jgi:hypothetical protein